ncbi:type II toxin-antitoxin system VapC family toxin [Candidatus Electronema sp. PJ]|uniref:type II toxin-antitoxin system VapC family toxin n=1 Tax=Candidatus Electronema sp. PJ TaxID=3401572 RepID=UPI003AA8A0DE
MDVSYLLDTNTCIAFFKNHPSVAAKIEEVGLNRLLLCAPVKAELWYGACKSARVAANQAVLRDFFAQLRSLPFDDESVTHYGEIRAFLTKAGTPIGPNDLLIAAIAKAHNVTLITHNVSEFSRVPEITLEDWQTR